MIEHYQQPGLDLGTCIGAYLIDPTLCDMMQTIYRDNPQFHRPGTVGNHQIDPQSKECTEMAINSFIDDQNVQSYLRALGQCMMAYKSTYTELDTILAPWRIGPTFKLQHYQPNEAYHAWHCERSVSSQHDSDTGNRMLTFMTYLNTVEDGGETEFKYQELEFKPQQGLTLIWPSDYTHTHRGLPSPTQDKWIATGWYIFEPITPVEITPA